MVEVLFGLVEATKTRDQAVCQLKTTLPLSAELEALSAPVLESVSLD